MGVYILNLQFPKSMEELKFQRDYWRDEGIDCLSNYEALYLTGTIPKSQEIGYWNAPLSAMPGDVCIFGCAKSAMTYIRKLSAEISNDIYFGTNPNEELFRLIQQSRNHYEKLGGTLFAWAYLLDKPQPDPQKNKAAPGWARMAHLVNIEKPISVQDIEGLQLNTFGGITKLDPHFETMLALEIGLQAKK